MEIAHSLRYKDHLTASFCFPLSTRLLVPHSFCWAKSHCSFFSAYLVGGYATVRSSSIYQLHTLHCSALRQYWCNLQFVFFSIWNIANHKLTKFVLSTANSSQIFVIQCPYALVQNYHKLLVLTNCRKFYCFIFGAHLDIPIKSLNQQLISIVWRLLTNLDVSCGDFSQLQQDMLFPKAF